MRAWIDNQKGVGYVVMWTTEGRTTRPLRCFGQNQSAAIEFRDWLNRSTDEKLDWWVKLYAETYDPAKKYSYPIFTGRYRQPALRLQKGGEDNDGI